MVNKQHYKGKSCNERLDLLVDHYNDTCNLSKQANKRRNREFLIICFLEALGVLMLFSPAKVLSFCLKWIDNNLGFSSGLVGSVVQTLLWLVTAYVTIRYVQDMLYVERSYLYEDALEKRITELSGEDLFCREGIAYQTVYPLALNFIDLFYKMIMPIVFSIINISLIYTEWIGSNPVLSKIIDSVLCGYLTIILISYFFDIHPRIRDWFRKCCVIRYLSDKLNIIMKYV